MSIVYSMDKFMGGAMAEKFSHAMREIAENVLNPNTSEKAKRKITITISIEPNEERDIASMSVDVKTTLASHKPLTSRLMFDRDMEGNAVAGEFGIASNPNQIALDVTDDGETVIDDKNKKEFKGLTVVN